MTRGSSTHETYDLRTLAARMRTLLAGAAEVGIGGGDKEPRCVRGYVLDLRRGGAARWGMCPPRRRGRGERKLLLELL